MKAPRGPGGSLAAAAPSGPASHRGSPGGGRSASRIRSSTRIPAPCRSTALRTPNKHEDCSMVCPSRSRMRRTRSEAPAALRPAMPGGRPPLDRFGDRAARRRSARCCRARRFLPRLRRPSRDGHRHQGRDAAYRALHETPPRPRPRTCRGTVRPPQPSSRAWRPSGRETPNGAQTSKGQQPGVVRDTHASRVSTLLFPSAGGGVVSFPTLSAGSP